MSGAENTTIAILRSASLQVAAEALVAKMEEAFPSRPSDRKLCCVSTFETEFEHLKAVLTSGDQSPLTGIMDEIFKELRRATTKHPLWPSDPSHASNIVGEEAGELHQAVLETTYEVGKSDKEDVRKEAVQTAVVAIRFLLSMDRYRFEPSEMHKQPAVG